MTNTERLIASLEHAAKHGEPSMNFMVGKYTGNGTSVVAALRRRGYRVENTSTNGTYRIHTKPTA